MCTAARVVIIIVIHSVTGSSFSLHWPSPLSSCGPLASARCKVWCSLFYQRCVPCSWGRCSVAIGSMPPSCHRLSWMDFDEIACTAAVFRGSIARGSCSWTQLDQCSFCCHLQSSVFVGARLRSSQIWNGWVDEDDTATIESSTQCPDSYRASRTCPGDLASHLDFGSAWVAFACSLSGACVCDCHGCYSWSNGRKTRTVLSFAICMTSN